MGGSIYTIVVLIVPDNTDAQSWYLLGRCYMSQQKYSKAYEAYQQAVYRDGRNPTFWCSIGVLYYQINQYRDALDAYSRAIRLNPYISEVWYDLGTLVRLRKYDLWQRYELIDDSTNHVTIRLPMLLTRINGPLTSTQAICISRLAYSFYVTTVNLQVCLTNRMPRYRKTCILNNTRTLALEHLPVPNGVFQQAPLLCFMDQAQHKMALHPIGVDVWQISPTRSLRLSLSLSLSLRPNLLVCTIRANLLDRPHHRGKAVRVRIRFGNTQSSTDTLQ